MEDWHKGLKPETVEVFEPISPHLFVTDEKSGLLAPKYSISSEEIAEFIKTKI